MKALTDRLEWVRLYMVEPAMPQTEEFKQDILVNLLAAIAIAEALPEITIIMPVELRSANRQPPKRIIEMPDG